MQFTFSWNIAPDKLHCLHSCAGASSSPDSFFEVADEIKLVISYIYQSGLESRSQWNQYEFYHRFCHRRNFASRNWQQSIFGGLDNDSNFQMRWRRRAAVSVQWVTLLFPQAFRQEGARLFWVGGQAFWLKRRRVLRNKVILPVFPTKHKRQLLVQIIKQKVKHMHLRRAGIKSVIGLPDCKSLDTLEGWRAELMQDFTQGFWWIFHKESSVPRSCFPFLSHAFQIQR